MTGLTTLDNTIPNTDIVEAHEFVHDASRNGDKTYWSNLWPTLYMVGRRMLALIDIRLRQAFPEYANEPLAVDPSLYLTISGNFHLYSTSLYKSRDTTSNDGMASQCTNISGRYISLMSFKDSQVIPKKSEASESYS